MGESNFDTMITANPMKNLPFFQSLNKAIESVSDYLPQINRLSEGYERWIDLEYTFFLAQRFGDNTDVTVLQGLIACRNSLSEVKASLRTEPTVLADRSSKK